MGLEYGKFLTPELQQELDRLGNKYGYSPGHFHVAFSLAQTFANKAHKTKLRDNLRFLIQHPAIEQQRLDSWLKEQLASAEGARRHEQFRLRSLHVENFGIFADLTLQFSESDSQPITLIGALNGSGKTTVFRALRSALYGLETDFVKEGTPLHNNGENGSVIKFQLDIEDGEGQQSRILREYHYRTGPGRPVLLHSTARLQTGTRVWQAEQVNEEIEQLLPAQLVDYFFFDAEEQIKQFLKDQQGNLKVGIERILGIERLAELDSQLEQIKSTLTKERKRLNEAKGSQSQKQIQEQLDLLDDKEARLRGNREEAIKRQANMEEDAAALKAAIEQLLIDFDPDRHVEYDRVTQELGSHAEELKRTIDELERIARDTLPLLLILGELDELHSQAQAAQLTGADSGANRVVSELYERAHQVFRRYDYDPKHLEQIFSQYRDQLSTAREMDAGLEDSPQQIRAMEFLLQTGQEGRQFSKLLSRRETLIELVDSLTRKKNNLIPPKTELAQRHEVLTSQREQLLRSLTDGRLELQQIEEQLKVIGKEQAALREKAGKAGDYSVELDQVDKEIKQVENFNEYIKSAGKTFRASQVHELEARATDAYRLLTNKPDLDRRIVIDPENFSAKLLMPEARFDDYAYSAGEQEVFAMSLVAGLAHTSQRRVPMIIDTPFGKLDTVHRDHICRYFLPKVAHQVVILSTNTEVIGESYVALRPHVGKQYIIDRDATGKENSFVREGYFS